MLGNRPRPVIGKLSALLVAGNPRSGFLDMGSSPRGPLDLKIQSPRSLKCYDLGGVGLGIVAALEKSSDASGQEILAKFAVCSPSGSNRSSPIPVSSGKNCNRCRGSVFEDSEDFTYVTCHVPNKSFTKVYYDGNECKSSSRSDETGFDTVKESPARITEDVSAYPTSAFLSSCNLCRKKLHGKDIYMYRGEKAFCSAECRSRQIMIDERKEQCRSEVARSADVSSSPYTRDHIFSTGIIAI